MQLNGIYGNITLLQDELESVREYMNHADWPEKNKTLEALEQMHICLESMTTCARHQKVITGKQVSFSLRARITTAHFCISKQTSRRRFASLQAGSEQDRAEPSYIQSHGRHLLGRFNVHVTNPSQETCSPSERTSGLERLGSGRGNSFVARFHLFLMLIFALRQQKSMLAVRGDPDRFMQVVVNLISNAIKFTHDGGIKIFVYYAHRDHKTTEIKVRLSFVWAIPIELTLSAPQVEIADTGIGMSKDEQARIFDRFSQVCSIACLAEWIS